jgi:hypothetical protein
MSLADVLPDIQSLSRADKLQLIEFLARDLAHEERGFLEEGKSYPIWSPEGAFEAAATLMQTLKDEKGAS